MESIGKLIKEKVEEQGRSIHACLECSLFLEKYPGMDMISFGPTL